MTQGPFTKVGRSSREAIDWLVANERDEDREELRRATLARWEDWCARSENLTQYAAMIKLRQEICGLPRPAEPSRPALVEDIADEGGCDVNAADRRRPFDRPRHLFSHRRLVLAAAAVALVAVGAAWLSMFRVSGVRNDMKVPQAYATAAGEQREVLLPDGSMIKLGGDTSLVARFTADARNIRLEHGEAYFRVTRDRRRPFLVKAGLGTTMVVGTAFEVRYRNKVEVWVREGAVEVGGVGGVGGVAGWMPVRVSGGEEMSYDSRGGASAPRQADPLLSGAWTEGNLVPLIYRGRSLSEVIADIQPYTRRHILLDLSAGELRYTGIVIQGDVDAWVHDLSRLYPGIDVIDCRNLAPHVPGCANPTQIVIRTRLSPGRTRLQSAQR